jgi:hypothetical protein
MPGMIDKPQIQPLSGNERVKAIQSVMAKLDAQNFGPNDSTIASTINHPVTAVQKGMEWLQKQMQIANSPYASSREQAEAATNIAGLAQLGSFPMAPKSAGGTLGSITAWHGSPHKFDKFDMSKIGTGEGAQAYGHGLYFAENPKVAKSYQEGLTDPMPKFGALRIGENEYKPIEINGIEKWFNNDTKEYADNITSNALGLYKTAKLRSPGNEEEYINKIINSSQGGFFKDKQNALAAQDLIRKIEPPQIGNLYKTSLEWPDPAREAADPLGPQHFLDWDKPLSEQPESVKSLLPDLIPELSERELSLASTGKYHSSKLHNLKSPGGSLLNSIKEQDLINRGIPGIRYLDGGSRGAGEGSYNYVVFDDKIPKIKERNGNPLSWLLPATALGYGMAGTRSPLNTPPGKASD